MVMTRRVVASGMAGLLGGLLRAGAMSVAHSLVASAGQRDASSRAQGDDATVKVADALSRIVRGRGLSEREKPAAGSAVHYAFGAAMGVTYGVLAPASRVATVGWGMGFGAAVWLGAHVIMVPALGLASSPVRQPLPKEGLELGMHLLYGVTVYLVRRVALRLASGSPRWPHP
jgi:hypothetical protein